MHADPGPSEHRFVELDSPLAIRYADLVGSLADLGYACDATDLLLAQWPSVEEQWSTKEDTPLTLTARALWNSALVAYARCFTTGVRSSAESVANLDDPAELRPTHDYFLRLRDKHVAHSVNALEQTLPLIGLDESGPVAVVAETGYLSLIRVLETREVTQTFRQICGIVAERVQQAANEVSVELLAEARATPIADLIARPTARVVAPQPEALAKGRRARKP